MKAERVARALVAAALMVLLAIPCASAQSANGPVQRPALPPISTATAQFFAANPDAFAAFQAQLAAPASGDATAMAEGALAARSTPWQDVTQAPVVGLCNPLLLTDGTVIVASCDTADWYKLTPDDFGNYAAGSWSQIASLPIIDGSRYAPQYHASAVLPDGRVIIAGGEYDGGNKEVWTNRGAIYDPVADSWTAVAPPSGASWKLIGDAQSVVLADGTFMLASCCANPAADALLDASTLTWSATGAPLAGLHYQDEQGYELLPSGDVLTLDIWTHFKTHGTARNAERYDPRTGTWRGAGTTPVPLPDPFACGTFEIGPAVLRGDGTVVAFGGHTSCAAAPGSDPTAIYDSATNSWSAGPNVPTACGSNPVKNCDLADAPAALLPDGNILFAASPHYGGRPTHFFEFTASNTIVQVADPLHFAFNAGAYYYNFLVLPNGQIFSTDFSNVPEVYTPTGAPIAAWAPVITSVAGTVARGSTYRLDGKQLNGLSQGAYYGDDVQTASNYPIVRITNGASGHVVYARTANHSTMSVAPGAVGSTDFTVPAGAETGPSSLSVIANGIASTPVSVTVE